MGKLNAEMAVTLLRSFTLAQLEQQAQWDVERQARVDQPPIWSWAPGTFLFPEALCCYCGGTLQSLSIWRVKDQQFLGSWKVEGEGSEGYLSFRNDHPHVLAGSVCMGGDANYKATSVADALFLGFNPLSMYFEGGNEELKEWFEDRFDHRCGEGRVGRTAGGVDNAHLVNPVAGCHCPHCRMGRGEVQCPREKCRKWYVSDKGHGRYLCSVCGGSKGKFCFKHNHDRRTCGHCRSRFELVDLETGKPKDVPDIRQCEDCKQMVCLWCLGEKPDTRRLHCCGEEEGRPCTHHCEGCCRENDCDYPNRCDECEELYDECACEEG